MKTFIYLFIGTIFLSSGCGPNSNKSDSAVITGDLYFPFISIRGYYGMDTETKEWFKKGIDSLKHSGHITKDDSIAILDFKILQDKDLIERPYIEIKVDSITTVTAYLNESAYEKVKDFDRQQLIEENKKVTLKLRGQHVTPTIFDCEEILSIDKVDAKTYWTK